MYCKNCGKPIDDDAKFCAYCGTNVSQIDSQEEFKKQQARAAWESQLKQRHGQPSTGRESAYWHAASSSGSATKFESTSPASRVDSGTQIETKITQKAASKEQPKKKSVFKRWWFWGVLILVIAAVLIISDAVGTAEFDGINTNEKLLTVDITLPASLFENEDMDTFDAASYAQENGFLKAIVNEDGSVSITMTKAKHNELLSEMSASLDESFAEFVDAEDTPYIKEISHNKDFSRIDIKVVRADYENSWDLTPLAVSISAMMYQAFLDMDYHVEVSVIDVDSGDIISTSIYPDVFDEISSDLSDNVLLDNNTLKATFVGTEDASSLGVFYVTLNIENKTDTDIVINLEDADVDGETIPLITTGVPLVIRSGNSGQASFIFSMVNLSISTMDDADNATFRIVARDNDTYDAIYESDLVTINLH